MVRGRGRPAGYALRAAPRERGQGRQGQESTAGHRVRARGDRGQDTRAHSGQERGRRRGAEHQAGEGYARGRVPGLPRRQRLDPSGGTGQGHLGAGRVLRPLGDAAPARRGDHGQRQERHAQRAAHLAAAHHRPAAGQDGAHRPQAGRALAVRAGTAPHHARGHRRQEGGQRAAVGRRRDGAALRGAGEDRGAVSRGVQRQGARARCPTSSSS